MRLLKYFIPILFVLIPTAAFASIATPWNATSTDLGYISPNLINGNNPWLVISGTGTSTFSNGINISNGCFAISGSCIRASGGSSSGLSTTSPWTIGNLAYVVSNGSVSSVATSTLTASSPLTGSFTQIGSGGALGCQTASGSQAGCLSSADWTTFNGKVSSQWTGTSPGPIYYQTGNVGVGTSSPWAALSVSTTTQDVGTIPLFAVASTTNATLFSILGNGNVGIANPAFLSFNRSTLTPQLQLTGIDNNNGISIVNHTASNIGANLILGKTSGTTATAFSALSNGNTIGRIFFTGSVNSTDASTTAAIILASVDGVPTGSALPGMLSFQTTQAGSTGAPTSKMQISGAGDVGIGTAPLSVVRLSVLSSTTTLTASVLEGLNSALNETPVSAAAVTAFGADLNATWAGGADSSAAGRLTGTQVKATVSGAGTSILALTGLTNQAIGNSTGTVGTAIGGAYTVSEQGGGTITNAYGGTFTNGSSGASSNITTSKAIWVSATSISGGGTITNNHGLYVDDESGGTNNINIYTGPANVNPTGTFSFYNNSGNISYFKSNVGIGTTTAADLLDLSASDSGTTLTNASAAMEGIINSNTTNNNFADLTFLTADASGNTVAGSKIAGVYTSHTGSAVSGDLTFLTRNAGTLAERVRITSTGVLRVTGLAAAAGTFLAADPSGNIIATTTPSGGSGTVTSIATNNGITGGTITTTGTIGLAAIGANSVLGNITGASAVPSAVATSSLFTGTTGQNAYFSGTGALVGTSTIFTTTGATVGIGTTTTTYGANSFTTAISNGITALGGLLINTVTNVVNAFSVINAAGTTVFNIDTTASNPFLGVGTTTPWATLSVIGNGTNPIFAVATTTNNGLPNFEIDSTGRPIYSGKKPTCDANCTFIAGNDARFRVLTGTAKTTMTITFSSSWGTLAPICVANEGGAGTVTTNASSTPTTVVLTPLTALTATDIEVHCDGIQ